MISIRAQILYWYMKLSRAGDHKFGTSANMQTIIEKNRSINDQPLKVPKLNSFIIHKSISGFSTYWIGNDLDRKNSIILYLHGGSFIYQPSVFHWRYVDKIVNTTKLPLVMAVYPKAPTHQFTEAYDFLIDVYTTMIHQGYKNIIFMGDSAGATLIVGLSMLLNEKKMPPPSKIVAISPCLDMTMKNPGIPNAKKHDPILSVHGLLEAEKVWAGKENIKDYRVSPIYGDLNSLPPTLFMIGSHDILCPDARKFRYLAETACSPLVYHEYPKMLHCFPLIPIPEADKANREIVKFITN